MVQSCIIIIVKHNISKKQTLSIYNCCTNYCMMMVLVITVDDFDAWCIYLAPVI